jgi:hypothetical protein
LLDGDVGPDARAKEVRRLFIIHSMLTLKVEGAIQEDTRAGEYYWRRWDQELGRILKTKMAT